MKFRRVFLLNILVVNGLRTNLLTNLYVNGGGGGGGGGGCSTALAVF